MGTVTERLEVFPRDITVLDLSNWNLSDDDLISVSCELHKYQNIEVVNISDNNFTYTGLTAFMNALKQLSTIREIILSNNWLLDNCLAFIHDVMIEHRIETLRMCNIQRRLTENSISRLCGLKISTIKNLYLDDNRIGNKGLQFLLTTLRCNEKLQSLHLCNNDISDIGVVFLGDFLKCNHYVQYVDIRDNALYKQSSVRILSTINTDEINHRVDFTMPELSPDHIPSTVGDLVVNKPFKDACVVFQLLRLILHLQNIDSPLDIPRELLFNPSLPSHQRIINRLVEQPSLLAQRIHMLIEYVFCCEDSTNDPIIGLIERNLTLLSDYLKASSVLKMNVILEEGDPFTFELPPVIVTTVGRIQRSGVVKLKIVQLFECIINKEYNGLIHSMIMNSIHSTILNLMVLHPWNSMIHETVTSYFETVLDSQNASLYFDIVANTGLAHFIMVELLSSDVKKTTGYYGFLVRIAIAIQHVFNLKSNLFFSLYKCDDENCLQQYPHPTSRKDWNDFYCKFISKHLNMCLVDKLYYDSDE